MTDKENKTSYIIPYIDQKLDFWKGLAIKYHGTNLKVYFPIMNMKIGSGRPQQPEKHLLKFLESKIFPVSVLINPVILNEPVERIIDVILKILESYITRYNLSEATITNLSLAKMIKESLPELKLSASTLMEIYNNQQLEMIADVFDTLVPSNRALRDIKTLTLLRNSFKGKIRILVNESCLPSCVFRTQHFYEMSNAEIVYPRSLCNELLQSKPWLRLTGGWILPQHLNLINHLYDEIKLSGRVSLQNPEQYIRVLDSYINKTKLSPDEIGGGPASVGVPIDIDSSFYEYTLSCEKNCNSCHVCFDYWKSKTNSNE